MKKLDSNKVFAQYRDYMNPYEPVYERKYTITHSDTTAQLFVFIAPDYAEDQITEMRDEVRITWSENANGLFLFGYVLVDGDDVKGNAEIRNKIFYEEMDKALQALRQADRFLFERYPQLDRTRVYIKFISDNPLYSKTYDFGNIGFYTL